MNELPPEYKTACIRKYGESFWLKAKPIDQSDVDDALKHSPEEWASEQYDAYIFCLEN